MLSPWREIWCWGVDCVPCFVVVGGQERFGLCGLKETMEMVVWGGRTSEGWLSSSYCCLLTMKRIVR